MGGNFEDFIRLEILFREGIVLKGGGIWTEKVAGITVEEDFNGFLVKLLLFDRGKLSDCNNFLILNWRSGNKVAVSCWRESVIGEIIHF